MDTTESSSAWLEIGAISGLVGAIITLFFSLFTTLYFVRAVVEKDANKKRHKYESKAIYTNSILYFASGCIVCCTFGLIRSTVITQLSLNDFTITQCEIGYILGLIFLAFNRLFLYVIIINRLKISFKQSIYEHNGMSYLALYWVVSVLTTLNGIIWMVEQPESEWVFSSNATNSALFCSREINESSSLIIARLCLYAGDITFKFFLLYLFWRGLLGIYRSLAHDVQENYDKNNKKIIKSGSAQHKLLHIRCEFVKKQTILLIFCVSSTFLYYLTASLALGGIHVLCLDIIQIIHALFIVIWCVFVPSGTDLCSQN